MASHDSDSKCIVSCFFFENHSVGLFSVFYVEMQFTDLYISNLKIIVHSKNVTTYRNDLNKKTVTFTFLSYNNNDNSKREREREEI